MNWSTAVGDGVAVGSGYCCNIRLVRHYSERACFAMSLVSNAVLAVMLVREKNVVMKPYSRVLLINVLFDVIYTIICMFLELVSSKT